MPISEPWHGPLEIRFYNAAGELDLQPGENQVSGAVEEELRGYLECGLLCFGFARAVCTGCNGRHMAQTAAHLADHVIPPVPVRQWMISVPKRLRGMLADRPRLGGIASITEPAPFRVPPVGCRETVLAEVPLTRLSFLSDEFFPAVKSRGPSVTAIPGTSRPRETDRQIVALEHLLEVARQLGATVELNPLLEAIATAATTVLDCERATVFLYDTNTEELYSRVATGIEDSDMTEIRFPVTLGIAGEVARSGSVITLPDAYADPRFNPDFDQRSGFRTRNILAFPLQGYDSTTVGVLQVLNKRSGQFDRHDEDLVRFLGAQAGVAVQRQMLLQEFADKQRIQRELNIARDIQQGLLPREQPEVAGYDIAGWNQPADETGGDSFDFLPLDDGSLAIAMADATGHGIGAALIMAETRALFRATVRQTRDLQRVMLEVNDLLCLDLPDGKFNTAFFGFLSPAEHTLRFLSAGQGPILVYAAATGDVRELETHGLPLGLIPEAEYDPASVFHLAPGDMLVLLTDGFYEWDRPDGQQFGTERIADLIRLHHRLPAAEFIRVVYRTVVEFSAGTRQGDDLTAVIVRRETAG